MKSTKVTTIEKIKTLVIGIMENAENATNTNVALIEKAINEELKCKKVAKNEKLDVYTHFSGVEWTANTAPIAIEIATIALQTYLEAEFDKKIENLDIADQQNTENTLKIEITIATNENTEPKKGIAKEKIWYADRIKAEIENCKNVALATLDAEKFVVVPIVDGFAVRLNQETNRPKNLWTVHEVKHESIQDGKNVLAMFRLAFNSWRNANAETNFVNSAVMQKLGNFAKSVVTQQTEFRFINGGMPILKEVNLANLANILKALSTEF
jgi:hypothetical protein